MEDKQDVSELLKVCRFLVDAKKHKMADSAIDYAIDRIAAALQKIDKK